MMAIYLTGGSRIEDAKRLSAQFSEKSQGYRLCSPNANVKLGQADTLRRAFEGTSSCGARRGDCRVRGVHFGRARMDCGSYAREVVDITSRHCDLFYIRAMMCDSLRGRIHAIPDSEWAEAEINSHKCSLASIPSEAFFPERGYRLARQRTTCEDGQAELLDGIHVYRCILTNDTLSGERVIVEFYNQRASTERCFDCMNNDFGWGCLPCSEMKANTVFMILTAFVHNFYRHFLGLVAGAAFGLETTSRVKRFVFSFISVPFKWVNCGSRRMLHLYTPNHSFIKLKV